MHLCRGVNAMLMQYDWLIENIHGLGSLYETPELLERATGQPLNAEIFKQHLISRYLN